MAKSKYETGSVITTPSQFGSHASMLVDSPADYELAEGMVICKDDTHTYVTYKERLDNGMADPMRYSGVDNVLA